jgi:dTMP kinase
MLIAVEGIDGCGKTTLVARLAAELRDRGRTVVVVRRYMLDEITALWWRLVDLDLVDQRGTAQLAAADYATGLQRIIVPALDAGSVVIADKYAYSHRVYFTLRGMGPAELDALFSNMLEPDHVLWPRMDAPAALERLRQARPARERTRSSPRPQHRCGVRALRPRRRAGRAPRAPLPRAPRAHRRAVRGVAAGRVHARARRAA